MMISIILFNSSDDFLRSCLKSVESQTYNLYETIIVDIKRNDNIQKRLASNFFTFQEALQIAKGDYIIIVPPDFYFENDTVLEDVVLNVRNNDIIICDSACSKGNNPLSREHIIISEINSASALLASNVYCFHSIFFKKSILNTINFEYFNPTDYHSWNLFLIENILQRKNDWLQLQIPVLHIDADKTQCESLFRIHYSEDYKAQIRKLTPLYYSDYELLQYYLVKTSDDDYKVLEKLGKSFLFKIILNIRISLFKFSYYKRKADRRRKEYIRQQSAMDAVRKKNVEKSIKSLPYNILKSKNDSSDIIVSLTSHSRRVIDSAPYAIYSMFTQNILPNRIVLFINRDQWTIETIPPLIKRLMISGLEVEFCEDVRSHTKLIPALHKFPDNPIVTIDDDIYYNEKMLEELLVSYNNSDKKTVICHQGCYPQRRNGKFLPYSDWETSKYKERNNSKTSLSVSAYGVSGVIYPPHVFPDEVFNKDVFLKIAPHTDDIWFWIMEYINGVKVKLIENSSQDENVSVDYSEYASPDSSLALYFENCFNGRNDKELKALLEYYCID